MLAKDRLNAKRVLLVQLSLALAASAVAMLFGPWVAASAVCGGLASLLPNAVFAWWLFAPYSAAKPGQLLGRAYLAELIKLVLTALIFAAVFVWLKPVNLAALFGAFLIVQVLAPLLAHRD